MKLRTVADIRQYLNETKFSPEKFSSLCGISNMTVRRWLKQDDSDQVPSKYWPMFDHAFSDTAAASHFNPSMTFQDGFEGLEKHVHHLGESAPEAAALQSEYEEKSKDQHIGKGLLDKVKMLFKVLTSPEITTYQRTLVLGAIIYFISPVDLIPDVTPVMGYVDDYAVVTMVLTSVSGAFRKGPENTKDNSDT